MRLIHAGFFLFALVGCTAPPSSTVWSKSGASDEELAEDTARCRSVARAFSSASPAPYPGSLGASAFGGEVVNLRQERYFGDCMISKGYSPQAAAAESKPSSSSAAAPAETPGPAK